MKIFSVSCPNCGASYEVAESLSAAATPGRAECAVCGALIMDWREPRLRALRLIVPPERKYPRVTPPSPA